MILEPKEAAIAYRCPVCGTTVISMVGIFSISGDLIKLKCSCKESELLISRMKGGKIRITVPCMLCPSPHVFNVDSSLFFSRELYSLACPHTGLELCFIGKKDKVLEATQRLDDELNDMLARAGVTREEYFDPERHHDNDNQLEGSLTDAQIEDIVRFMLAELSEEGQIDCGCSEHGESGDYDFEFIGAEGDILRLFCHKCGYEYKIRLGSSLDANAFLHADGFHMTPPEDTDDE